MSNHVLDASASVDMLLRTQTGRTLRKRLPIGVAWYVPEHFYVEVAGAIRRAELRGEISRGRAIQAFSDLRSTFVRRVAVRPLLSKAWSRRGHLTVADALYVVLAEDLDATLVTSDAKLARAPGMTIKVLMP